MGKFQEERKPKKRRWCRVVGCFRRTLLGGDGVFCFLLFYYIAPARGLTLATGAGWSVGRSLGRLVGWSVGRLVGWSVGRFGWLVGWLITAKTSRARSANRPQANPSRIKVSLKLSQQHPEYQPFESPNEPQTNPRLALIKTSTRPTLTPNQPRATLNYHKIKANTSKRIASRRKHFPLFSSLKVELLFFY